MKKSHKSDEIQDIIDEWLVNFSWDGFIRVKKLKKLTLQALLTKKACISFRPWPFVAPVPTSCYKKCNQKKH